VPADDLAGSEEEDWAQTAYIPEKLSKATKVEEAFRAVASLDAHSHNHVHSPSLNK
jgi:hypothetical protein